MITVQEEVEETKVTLLFLLFMMFMVMMDIVRRPITMADTGRESRLRDRVSADLHDQTGERLQKCHQVPVHVFIIYVMFINCDNHETPLPLISLNQILLHRPACEVSEKMECVENTVSQCSFEIRLGSTGEEEEVEVGNP